MAQRTRLFELLDLLTGPFAKPVQYGQKENGAWVTISTADFVKEVQLTALGLIQAGIQAGDRVALISNNRMEWNMVDFALQQIGAISVPMYSNLSAEDIGYIFADAGVSLVFVNHAEAYEKAEKGLAHAGIAAPVYCFDPVPGRKHFSQLKASVVETSLEQQRQERMAAVTADDLVTLIYTSGTTGKPKGVMLTHHNILSNVAGSKPAVPVNETHTALSFLPLCHIYERMLSYLYMDNGLNVYYAESNETVAANLQEVKPHIFTTVPRLLEKVYDKILAKGLELKGMKRAIFFWALNLGLRYEISQPNGWWYDIQLNLARKLVFKKWQAALGGNILYIVSGGAALQPRLARVFWAAGITVMEGYGLTETSPVISVNRSLPEGMRVGTVGLVLDNVEVKLAPDGEILAKGPSIMKGYYKQPQLTAEVIDEEGFFHTGDIGEMIEGRFLKITDRKKEIFKTSGGKYIIPQKMENMLKESMVIEQAMIVGDGEKYAAALIVSSEASLKDWCRIKGMAWTSYAEMLTSELVIDKFQKEIDKTNAQLGQFETVKKFVLLADTWSVESGELTPTLKLKRKYILQKYQPQVAGLFTA